MRGRQQGLGAVHPGKGLFGALVGLKVARALNVRPEVAESTVAQTAKPAPSASLKTSTILISAPVLLVLIALPLSLW